MIRSSKFTLAVGLCVVAAILFVFLTSKSGTGILDGGSTDSSPTGTRTGAAASRKEDNVRKEKADADLVRTDLDGLLARFRESGDRSELEAWLAANIAEHAEDIGAYFLEINARRNVARGDEVQANAFAMNAFTTFLEMWGEFDGPASIAFIEIAARTDGVLTYYEQLVIEGWLRADPAAAEAFVWKKPVYLLDEDHWARRVTFLNKALWAKSPELYMKWLKDHIAKEDPAGSFPLRTSIDRMSGMVEGDRFPEAAGILGTYEDIMPLNTALRPFVERYAESDPTAALDWASERKAGENTVQLVGDTLNTALHADGKASLDLLSSPTGERMRERLREKKDAEGVSDFDRVAEKYSLRLSSGPGSHDSEIFVGALRQLDKIEDPNMRSLAAQHIEDNIRIRYLEIGITDAYQMAGVERPPRYVYPDSPEDEEVAETEEDYK